MYGWDDHQKAIQLSQLSGQAFYELVKELNDADSYRYDLVMKMLSEHFDSHRGLRHGTLTNTGTREYQLHYRDG